MRQTANLGVVQYSGIWKVPNAVSQAALTDGCVTTSFTWGAPANNGGPILKYGYQISINDGAYGAEVETTDTSYSVSTQYATTTYKIRVRAYTAAGWGPYSTVSSANAPWVLETETTTGTETETVTGSETDNSSDSESQSQNCECGTQSRTRTRSKSRTRTRTETRTRTRTQTRTRMTKSSCTAQSWSDYTYGTWSAWSGWSYGAWSEYSGWTYGEWGAYGEWGTCSGGTLNYIDPLNGGPSSVVVDGITLDAYILGYTAYYPCGYCQINVHDLYQCSVTGTYSIGPAVCTYLIMCE